MEAFYDWNNNRITLSGNCKVTGKPHSITVSLDGYMNWQNGQLIQRALPDATPEEREFILSGTSPEGLETNIWRG